MINDIDYKICIHGYTFESNSKNFYKIHKDISKGIRISQKDGDGSIKYLGDYT